MSQYSRFLSCALLVAASMLDCQSFDRAEYARLTGRSDSGARPDGSVTADGGGDAATDAGPVVCAERTRVVSPSCTLNVVPSLPPNLPNTLGMTKVFAVRRVTVGAGGAWQTIGHDRDGMCTSLMGNDGGAPMFSCRSPLPLMDGVNGRDNALGAVIGQVGVFGGSLNETDLNSGISEGNSSIGLRLRDFGGVNDGSITVELLPLSGGHPAGNPTAMPNWDGRDEWGINRSLAYGADGRTIRVSTTDAFSSCGTVVMPFPNNAPLYFSNDRIRTQLTLTDIRVVGQLDANGNLPSVELSALWARNQVFEDLRTFGACQELLSTSEWTTILLGIAAALDIPASGVANPAADCSAMSVGFRFDLVPVTLTGDVSPPPPMVTDPCMIPRDAGTRG